MARVRLSLLKSIKSSAFRKKEPSSSFNLLNSRHARSITTTCGNPLLDGVSSPRAKASSSPASSIVSNLGLHHNAKPFNYSIPFLGHSSYARAFSSKPDNFGSIVAPAVTSNGNGDADWVVKAKDVLQTSVDAVTQTARKTKEASDDMIPHVHQFLDSNPYLKEVIVPISLTMTATLFAWVVMPSVLRRFHTYAMQSSAALLPGGFSNEDVPYEKSFWGALEDPARYLVTFIAFAQIAAMVAPTTIAAQYFSPTVKGAVILSLVWFLYRWKTNVITRMLSAKSFGGLDREKVLTLDKVSSVGLFAIGLMASAEACGVAVQSILTVGGVGGVATAFAARDILGNVLSGLSMQFSRPFSMGDTIKAGSVEGQVVEMGLTTTSLLNAEKFPVLVPNSLFSSQVIVNKSRAQWRAIASKIPLQIDDLDKIPEISNEIKEMLKANTKVFLGKEAPHCYLSRVEKSFAELSIGCNLKQMGKEELYTTQQEVLIESVKIIQKHGVSLGTTWDKEF
ncbi:PREDICTED: mechanosensitive ion channel protein 1, mitochondrial-like [Camelina sativa]|uniref:Mechanosensitive ion channel protein 1, mitochondrial-like n=1 Tax=Camelina sativa TaxID=90675 RepID=A0ABM0T1L7_CAMSA|nr:PREDICTED: mechanosensitive ion channel protein 1, mitochondrial-like [Camelina sativa]